MENVKVVFVGDHKVGKTCVLYKLTGDETPGPDLPFTPTVFDNYSIQPKIGGHSYNIGLWDTAGQEDYDRLRPLSYPETDIFVLCFSSISRTSLHNLKEKWLPEVEHHAISLGHYLILQTKGDLYSERRKQLIFARVQTEHPLMLDELLDDASKSKSRKKGSSLAHTFPTDLIDLILAFSEYTKEEIYWDDQILSQLIDEEEIEAALNDSLRFGVYTYEKKSKPAFLRVSAWDGTNIVNGALMRVIVDLHRKNQHRLTHHKRGKCLTM